MQQQAYGGVVTHCAGMHGALSHGSIHMSRFDGDGMVHACRIKGGKASYSNRLVKTHRLQREVKQGFPLYLRVCCNPCVPLTGLLLLMPGACGKLFSSILLL